jgi:hypothetical protein
LLCAETKFNFMVFMPPLGILRNRLRSPCHRTNDAVRAPKVRHSYGRLL